MHHFATIWKILQQLIIVAFAALGLHAASNELIATLARQQIISATFSWQKLVLTAPYTHWVDCNCVSGIYLSAPVLSMGLGLLLLVLIPRFFDAPAWWRMLQWWIGIFGVGHFLAAWGSGLITETRMWYAMAWMYWPVPLQYVVTGMSLILSLMLGWWLRYRVFIALGYTEEDVAAKRSQKDVALYFLLPVMLWMVAVSLFIPPFSDGWILQMCVSLSVLLMLLPSLTARRLLRGMAFEMPLEGEIPPLRWSGIPMAFILLALILIWLFYA